MTREHRLAKLLMDLFPLDSELRSFLHGVGGQRFVQNLPTAPVALTALSMDAVISLGAWGLLGPDLWDKMAAERPGRIPDIHAVRGAFMDRVEDPGTWLAFGELCQLLNLVLGTRALSGRRDALFAQIPSAVLHDIPAAWNEDAQTLTDVHHLNQVGDGNCWLQRWLENVRVLLAKEAQRAAGIDYFLACVASRSPMRNGLAWTLLRRSENAMLQGWPRFSHPLRYTLSVASSLVRAEVHRGARQADDVTLPTKFFMAALRVLRPEPIGEILSEIPIEALEEPLLRSLHLDPDFLIATPEPSPCLRGALLRLLNRLPAHTLLTPGDVFVDVAKYGRGESVERLRKNGVSASKIDELATKIGFRPLRTEHQSD